MTSDAQPTPRLLDPVRRGLAAIPAFQSAPKGNLGHRPLDPDDPSTPLDASNLYGADAPAAEAPQPESTRTVTYSEPSEAEAKPLDPKLVTRIAVAALGLVLVLAGAGVRMKFRGMAALRPMDDNDRNLVGEPLGRILARHAPNIVGNDDLVDAVDAGSAFAAWATDGPLLLPTLPVAGVPADLQDGAPE